MASLPVEECILFHVWTPSQTLTHHNGIRVIVIAKMQEKVKDLRFEVPFKIVRDY